MDAESRLEQLGLVLPKAPEPAGSYLTFVCSGNLAYTSGHGPDLPDGSQMVGKVGRDLSLDAARYAARLTGLSLLSTMRLHLVSLNRVARVLKVLGLVNATPQFTEHPAVVDGCSDLFLEVFGDVGRHARSAIGVESLPANIPVEIEVIVEIHGH